MLLEGKVALVTGGASGIGRAQAMEFARAGARVFALDISPDGLDTLRAEGEAAGLTINSHVADISRQSHVEAAVAKVESVHGSVDILANTAGVLDGFTKSLDTSWELWNRVIEINLTSVFRLTNLVLPGMVARGAGVIVNIASIAGLGPGAGGAAYTASKHALIGYTRQLALDYGRHGIRANAICPGMIETAMTRAVLGGPDSKVATALRKIPAGRVGTPEDIARLARYLASEEADFIHGAAVVIDGGLTLK